MQLKVVTQVAAVSGPCVDAEASIQSRAVGIQNYGRTLRISD
jgi:hypothetical protein